MKTTYDYIIVGAGTAGCVLANRLSTDNSKSVLLLEAGGKDNYFWIDIPVGYLFTVGNPKTDWCYKIEPDPGLNGRTIGYARGKVLGGSSSINAMIYMRGQKSDFDYWESLGNRSWGWKNVLPIYKKSEDYQHGADEFHGVGGELRVEERRVNWEILDAWRDAAEECGIKKINEFNRGDNLGNSYFQMNQRKGSRWSATKAYIRPIVARKNLTILTHAHVKKIKIDTLDSLKIAKGVLVSIKKSQTKLFSAKREVILCAGSIGSPQILQLSGIADKSLLDKIGIPLIHELKGVGENLHDHLQIRSVYQVQNTVTLNQRINSIFGKIKMGLEYFVFKTGPLTMPPSQLGAFAKSDPSQPTANMEWHVQPLSLDKFGDPLHTFNAITPAVCNLRPTSRGYVRIKSNDSNEYPSIKLNYLSTPEDEKIAVLGLKFTRKIMSASALKKFQPKEILPGEKIESDKDILDAARNLGTTIFHPVGTCKMGSDLLSVVNDRLQVHGIKNLRVVDASIMPRITSGNTNAPTVMIAEKGAEFIINNKI